MFNLERHPQKNHRCFPTDRLKSTMCNEKKITQLVYVFILRTICNTIEKFNNKNMWNYQSFTHMIIYVNGTCVKRTFKINFVD